MVVMGENFLFVFVYGFGVDGDDNVLFVKFVGGFMYEFMIFDCCCVDGDFVGVG